MTRRRPLPITTPAYHATTPANGLLEYYMRDKRLDRDLDRASKFGILYGEGYILLEWDVNKGEVYKQEPVTDEQGNPTVDQQRPTQTRDIRNGDIVNSSMSPTDIIRDTNKTDYKDLDWIIVRKFKNKFDLASTYQEWSEEIIEMSYTFSEGNHDYIGSREYGSTTDPAPGVSPTLPLLDLLPLWLWFS